MAVRYAESDGASIAYEVLGESGPDLLLMPPVGNRAVARAVPIFRRYYDGLARFSRLVICDRRGMGMSDSGGEPPTLAQLVADLDAVRRAVGVERVALTSAFFGSLALFAYALTHPERVTALVLMNGVVGDLRDAYDTAAGAPGLLPWELLEQLNAANFESYLREYVAQAVPGIDEAQREQHLLYYKASATPRTFRAQLEFARGVDLRPHLGEIQAPTLVLQSSRDRFGGASHGRYLRDHLPSVRYVELDTAAYFPWMEADSLGIIVRAYEEFLSGRVAQTASRFFAAFLVVDIVQSTARQRRSGDAAWSLVREEFEAEARALVERFGGRIVQFLGDGLLARFALASEALHVARRLGDVARGQGVEIRTGVHAGEAEDLGADVSGICVNIAVRVAAQAQPSEILTTATVRDLVEGSAFRFADAGEAELKGVGRRRLCRLEGG